MIPSLRVVILASAVASIAGPAFSDEASSQTTPTRHQLMKDCMAKQKASDGGMPHEQMKKNCKDVTKTEEANVKAEKQAEEHPAATPSN